MFESYVSDKTTKRRGWKTTFIVASVVLHVAAVTGLLIRGYWVIEKLPVPRTETIIGSAPPPPPPPPPGGHKKAHKEVKKHKIKVHDTVQPTKNDKKPDPVEDTPDESGQEGGEEGGVEGGVVGGVVGGQLGGVLGGELGGIGTGPPKVEKETPKIVPVNLLKGLRIAGEEQITPPDKALIAMSRSGKSTVVATAKMCLTSGGSVKSVRLVKASGFPSWDRKIKAKIQAWKYRPYMVNGKAIPVCTAVTFVYKP